MLLPEPICACMDALENAGFAAYAVGGCVRDSLLGITPHDYDLCTAATPGQIRQVFADYRLILAGEKHGTVGVVVQGTPVEITTFRTEGGYEDNRHPDWVRFVPDITQDLSRRDFTVNAMAFSPTRGFADPFGGREDLADRRLRAVGEPAARFREDALRILRGVRFAVRFGLEPEPDTAAAMEALAPLLHNLASERVFDELSKLLPLVSGQDILRFAPILTVAIPELAPLVGFDQHSPHHAHDLLKHTALVVEAVPPQLHLRLAALLHDVGKPDTFFLDSSGRGHFPGHAKRSAEIADGVLRRLKSPTALRSCVTDLIARHMTPLESDRKLLRRRMGRYGVQATWDLLALQQADYSSKGTGAQNPLFAQVRTLMQQLEEENACLTLKDLAVNGSDLLAQGHAPGPQLGRLLNSLLTQVQDERLPNEKAALLQAAKDMEEPTL